MVGWLTPQAAAADRRDPVRTAARKYRARSTRMPGGYSRTVKAVAFHLLKRSASSRGLYRATS
ncbi:hypothetical protein TPA0906_73010 [Streptomyces olivaceus]|nr:hypothetical protein TPA0906_73010 [Streptomyces olivaceus]